MMPAMHRSAGSESQTAGWKALAEADWEGARSEFEAELANGGGAAAWDGLGKARWWLSDVVGAVQAWEHAYTGYRRDGLDESAAHVATLLSREHAEGLGNDALAN